MLFPWSLSPAVDDDADDASTLRLVAAGHSGAARAQAARDEAQSEAEDRAAGRATQEQQDAKRAKREVWPKQASSLWYQAFWLNHFFDEPFRRRRDAAPAAAAAAAAAPTIDAAPALAPSGSSTKTGASSCSAGSASSAAVPSASGEEEEEESEEAGEPCPFGDEHPVVILMRQALAELQHKRERDAATAGRAALQPDGDALSSSPPNARIQQVEQLLRTLEDDPAARTAWATLKRHFAGADSAIDCMWFAAIRATMQTRFPQVDTTPNMH